MASGPVHELRPAEGSGADLQLPRVGNKAAYLPLISVPGHWSSALHAILVLSTLSANSSVLLGAGRGLPSRGHGTRTWGRSLPDGRWLHMRGHFQKTSPAHFSKSFFEGKRNFIPLAISHEHKNHLGGAHQAKLLPSGPVVQIALE